MPRHKVKTFTIFALFLLFSAASQVPCWEAKTSKHVQVFYYQRDSALAERAISLVESNFERVAESIGFSGDPVVYVFLPHSEEEFDLLTRGRIPDWGIGCALPEQRAIILRPSSKGKVELDELVMHELSHVLLGQATRGEKLPRWFDEGVAMWQSKEWKLGQSLVMRKAVFLDQVIPLREINGVLSFPSPKAQLAYVESFLALVYLFHIGGQGTLRGITREMASGKDFDQALYKICGCSEEEFEAAWERYVKSKYSLASIFLNSFNFWIAVLALLVVVYLVKRHHTKRILQRWEMEEDEGEKLTLSWISHSRGDS